MKNTIWIVPIEPLENRYTEQWYNNIPVLLKDRLGDLYNIENIDGSDLADDTTSGAFLNFAATNHYKSTQVCNISQLFMDGKVQNGDKFLVTDAWNFVITPIKYMSELLDIPVEIHGIWHAGSYDPSDILGKKMTTDWSFNAERSWFLACERGYFATEFHRNMFLKNLDIPEEHHHKAVACGHPYEYLLDMLDNDAEHKSNRIMWPHRYNYDKQPEIAEDLDSYFDVMITQKHNFSKKEYYDLLSSSKLIFSCALHENLGVSMIEGTLSGCLPVVPNRCCYSNIYLPEFIYPSEWTQDLESYKKHKKQLFEFLQEKLDNYDNYQDLLNRQVEIIKNQFISSDVMVSHLKGSDV